ncbi:sensor histidine kinase [Alishewanella tabrizica]|uniref:Two-component sensor histidine kinase n=1 Tax=Alishewanella tabrizica TaxID=671278 RepID=A0ABQ2WR06_9ALTE|nr:sensor histidine kinase [Alishewanella tabrizica]GGW66344.1 two-component sensor histidine kinase [Alishewanella tabrizica]
MNLRLEQKMSWVYLLNLTLFLAPLLFVPYQLWHYAAMLVALISFLYCYFAAYRQSSTQMHWPILGMMVIATLVAPINPGAISMFSFAGFFIGFAYKLRRYLLLMAALCAILITLDITDLILWPYFLLLGVPVVIGVSLLGRVEQQRQLRLRQERQSADEIKQLATIVERERIGRDLHDILGHTLSSIILKADLAEKLLARQQAEAAQQQLSELSTIARDALSQVRQSVSGFKHQGLTTEVAKLLSRLRDAGFQVELYGEIPQLDSRRETALVLALTELITNVMRHSQGDSCQLHFISDDKHLQLELTDNGKGAECKEGNGLTGLRERLSAIGAHLTLQQNQGFQAIIDLPLKEPL